MKTLSNKLEQLGWVCVSLTDVPSRTGDVSSTCEVAFWQRVGSTNDETSSATYGNRAAHATVDISNECSFSRDKDPASRKCLWETGFFDFYRLESTELLTDDWAYKAPLLKCSMFIYLFWFLVKQWRRYFRYAQFISQANVYRRISPLANNSAE